MWREIGPIVRVQVQRASLKAGERPHRYYDPAPLLAVPELLLTERGALGLVDGERIVDVHHNDHPESRNRGDNPLSIGFTGHYDAMRAAYGPHLTDGIAGENMLVAAGRRIVVDELAGLAIRTAAGQIARLTLVIAAPPCVEFSRFARQDAEPLPEAIRETLQFLDGGTRGFYAHLAPGQPEVIVRPGDLLLVEA